MKSKTEKREQHARAKDLVNNLRGHIARAVAMWPGYPPRADVADAGEKIESLCAELREANVGAGRFWRAADYDAAADEITSGLAVAHILALCALDGCSPSPAMKTKYSHKEEVDLRHMLSRKRGEPINGRNCFSGWEVDDDGEEYYYENREDYCD